MEEFVRSGNKMLRMGFTTGTCAALAASGAVELFFRNVAPSQLQLMTPKGILVTVKPDVCRLETASDGAREAVCMIKKDAGDDCDVTDGALIGARIRAGRPGRISIDGGKGVGRVTKPGLKQMIGEAAINEVPMKMIRESVEIRIEQLGISLEECGVDVVIFVPAGEEIAKKTFNSNLGIVGGVSILGTSGIVEPMSEKALVDTIEADIRQKRIEYDDLLLVPGNYGEQFLKDGGLGNVWMPPSVQCSNFIGDAIDIARVNGFSRVLLVGHLGKLVKLAGGIMNTHSRMADCRMELLTAHAALAGAGQELCRELIACTVTDAAVDLLEKHHLLDSVMESITERIHAALSRRGGEDCKVGAVVYLQDRILCVTPTAHDILERWKSER